MVAAAEKNEKSVNRTEGILAKLSQLLEQIPLTSGTRKHLEDFRDLLRSQRPARIMVMGRSRAGKSSLINAICGYKVAEVSDTKPETGKAQWQTFAANGVDLVDILDTRGLQESHVPRQYDSANNPTDSIIQAVKDKCPDIILMVCKATEVHSATLEDIDICELIVTEIKKQHNCNIVLIPVLTQCDQIAPHKIDFPTDNERKNRNLDEFSKAFYGYLQQKEKLRYCIKEVVPTVAVAEYQEGKKG